MSSGDRGTARVLASYAARFWKGIVALSVFGVVASALTVIQPMLIAAMLSMIVGRGGPELGGGSIFDLNHLGGRFLEWLGLAEGPVLNGVLVVGLLAVLHAALAAVLEYGSALLALRIRTDSARAIQGDLLAHLLPLSLKFFHRERSGELVARVAQDAVNAGHGLGPVIRVFIVSGGQIVIYGFYLVSTDAWLTLGALGLLGAHLLMSQALRRPVRQRVRNTLDIAGRFSAALQETLTTIRVAKSFGAERYELNKLKGHIDQVAEASMAEGRVVRLEPPARSVLDAMAVIGILLIGVTRLGAGSLTMQGLLMYLVVGRQVISPINAAATAYVFAHGTLGAFERIGELLRQPSRLPDGTLGKERLEERIEFRDVTFSYESRPALTGVSLTVAKGEVVAIVGPSGAGKSTLMDLLLRLYDPERGQLLIDGIDVRSLRRREYLALFGVVPQETLLYHDTIRNNIRYGRDGLTDEDVEEAARIANAHDFIRRLSEGYDTVVGDRGVRLSGGERQRVAIARAIVHRPQILILDEATSAVDAESEQQVQSAIERILKTATAFVIAHRISTVSGADRIVVLAEGRVVDVGPHDALLGRCELYRALCRSQFLSEDVP